MSGAALAGFAITILKRYQLITILSAIIMTAGVFLLTRSMIKSQHR